MTFEGQLALGHEGEKVVDLWLRERGHGVIQSYAFLGSDDDKAPRLRYLSGGFVLPDLDVLKTDGRCWVEVKSLWHAPENRARGIFVHGIKKRLHADYLRVEQRSGAPVFLCVLEMSTGALLVAPLAALTVIPCQRKHAHSTSCLVYFDRASFRLAANLSERRDFSALRAKYAEARRSAA